MTATATVPEIQIDPARIAHRKSCAYLKGFVVGYAVKAGMKWDGDPDRTPEFRKGFDDAQSWRYGPTAVTYVHCLYNSIRHDRPHLGSTEKDNSILSFYRGNVRNLTETTLLEFGAKEVM